MKEILSKKDKVFVKEIAKTGNKTKSAKKAYGYKNDNTAGVMALEKLRKPKIQEAIKSIADSFSDEETVQIHKELLKSTRIDHMVFPLGPKDEDDINFSGGITRKETSEAEVPERFKERTTLSDKEIIEMLAEVNCKVRRIVHGETARHVYFWSADNMARDKALEKVYKLKGSYAPEKKSIEIDEELIKAVSNRVGNILE